MHTTSFLRKRTLAVQCTAWHYIQVHSHTHTHTHMHMHTYALTSTFIRMTHPSFQKRCALKGGPRGAGQHMHPAGLHYTEALLPNLPYKNATGAVVHAWRPAHWYTVQFEVGAATPSTTASTPPPPSSSGMDKDLIADAGTSTGTGTDGLFSFVRGGFQGGEGFPSGAEWWIQGVREELDSPLEYVR